MSDRIDFITGAWVDDVVLDATSVHIEDLGDRIWIAVERPDGDRFCFECHESADAPIACMLTDGSVGSLKEATDD